jgi:tol-pal system protein YbgF
VPKRLARAAVLLLWAGAAGCATQANMVDLQSEVADLKARLARVDGGAPPPGPTLPFADFTPATAAPGGAPMGVTEGPPSDTQTLDLTIAVDQLRAELAELRGRVEEQGYTVGNLTQEIDARLAVLEDKAGVAPLPSRPGLAPGGAGEGGMGAGETPPAVVSTPGGGVVLPGVMIAPREGDEGPGVSARTAYDLAAGDYKRGHYSLAATGFGNFLEQYPESSLVPDAVYWLGESYHAQGLNARAVKVWEMQAKEFPKADTTPQALLSLGETYRAMDNIPAAEEALKRLIASFPVSDEAQRAKLILSELR